MFESTADDRRTAFATFATAAAMIAQQVAGKATRDALFREMVDRMYEHGKALSVATHFEIDDVIDPADTRRWIARLLDSAPQTHWRDSSPRRPNIDTW